MLPLTFHLLNRLPTTFGFRRRADIGSTVRPISSQAQGRSGLEENPNALAAAVLFPNMGL